jgi:hypothetical protein
MRSWQASMVGVGVAGLVLGGGLVLGTPDAIADGPSNTRQLDTPPRLVEGQAELPIGDSLQMWGRPSRLSIFWTSDPTDKIVKTYSDAWTSAGFTPHVDQVDKVSTISVVDTSSGLMRSVTVIDQQEERIVMPGIMDVRVAPDMTPRHAPLPVPENAEGYLGHSADDVTSVSYNGSFRVALTPSRVMDFYELELGKSGYKPREAPKDIHGGASREWERDSEWISVIATDDAAKKADEGEGKSMVVITHVRALAPPAGWKP